MSDEPITCRRKGMALIPHGRFHNLVASICEDGEDVMVTVAKERNMRSHRHYFAVLDAAFASMPETYAGAPWMTSRDAMRQYALIREGYATASRFACADEDAARHLAASLREITPDAYVEAVVEGASVTLLRAETQNTRAMGKDRFEDSKAAVIDFCANLLGVTIDELARMCVGEAAA